MVISGSPGVTEPRLMKTVVHRHGTLSSESQVGALVTLAFPTPPQGMSLLASSPRSLCWVALLTLSMAPQVPMAQEAAWVSVALVPTLWVLLPIKAFQQAGGRHRKVAALAPAVECLLHRKNCKLTNKHSLH